MPNTSLNNSNLILPRFLVKISRALSQLLQYSIMISFHSTFSVKKWNCVSLCFVFLWNTRLFASFMELSLSHWITLATFCSYPTSRISLLNQTTSHLAVHIAWYSSSTEDKDTVFWFLVLHVMTQESMLNT